MRERLSSKEKHERLVAMREQMPDGQLQRQLHEALDACATARGEVAALSMQLDHLRNRRRGGGREAEAGRGGEGGAARAARRRAAERVAVADGQAARRGGGRRGGSRELGERGGNDKLGALRAQQPGTRG